MLFTIDDVTLRVDAQGRVRYARCNRTNRFIKHATAQALLFAERFQAALILCLAVLANVAALAAMYYL